MRVSCLKPTVLTPERAACPITCGCDRGKVYTAPIRAAAEGAAGAAGGGLVRVNPSAAECEEMGTTEEIEGTGPVGHAWVCAIAQPQGRRRSLETHRGGDPGAGVDYRLPRHSEQTPHLSTQ